jgi:protein O-mannosyl-transferase
MSDFERSSLPSPALRRPLLLALGFVALALIVYARVLTGGFLWDDDGHITPGELRTLGGLWRIWFDVEATQQYYPLLHTAFWLQQAVWGDAPLGYHVVTVVLHGTAACLFARVLHVLHVPGALLAAALFALHPVHVESVAWISEQKNTLSAVLYLLAALLYVRFDTTRRPHLYAGASLFFVLALLTKTVTATLPGALLVVLWWRRGTLRWRTDVLPLIPWILVGAAAGLFTAWVERKIIGAEGVEYELTLLERCLLAGRVVWFYLGKLVWPANLSFIYPRWTIQPASLLHGIPLAAAVLLTWWAWGIRARSRTPLAVLLYFGGTLFPVLGFLNVYPFRYSFVADHFQYLASMGVMAFAGAGLAWLIQQRREVTVPATGAVLVALGLLSAVSTGKYRDAETLWRATIATNPAGPMPWLNLGATLMKAGRYDEAAAALRRSAELKPDYAEVYNNLGIVEMFQGRFVESIPFFERTLVLSPFNLEARNNLGLALRKSNRTEEAIASLRIALERKPDFTDAANNLGCALMDAGRPHEALPYLESALRERPADPEIHHNRANALRLLGRLPDAIAGYQQALRLDPSLAETHDDLGVALAASGRMDEAMAHYRRALELQPGLVSARTHLGIALGQTGRLAEALHELDRVLNANPDDAPAVLNRGIALSGLNRWPEARDAFARAAQLQPDSAEAHRNLAVAFANTGGLEQAVEHLHTALRLEPDSVQTHAFLSQALQVLGRLQEAAEHRIRAEALSGQRP